MVGSTTASPRGSHAEMSACPVCYRDLAPVAGRCPACGAERSGETVELREIDDESTHSPGQRAAPATARMPPSPAAREPRLILKGAAGEVTEFPLADANVLGRSTQATVRLADREVSRKHSQIDREGQDYAERDLNELLSRILSIAFDLIPADNGVILLRDARSHELVIQAMRQRKPGQGKVLVSDTLLSQVQATHQGVLTSDAISDERFSASH